MEDLVSAVTGTIVVNPSKFENVETSNPIELQILQPDLCQKWIRISTETSNGIIKSPQALGKKEGKFLY